LPSIHQPIFRSSQSSEPKESSIKARTTHAVDLSAVLLKDEKIQPVNQRSHPLEPINLNQESSIDLLTRECHRTFTITMDQPVSLSEPKGTSRSTSMARCPQEVPDKMSQRTPTADKMSQGEQFHVHRCVLAATSPCLQIMLRPNWC